MWEQDIGIAEPCPTCEALYAEWINYEKLGRAYRKKGPAYGKDI
jgi:hypothetical protein